MSDSTLAAGDLQSRLDAHFESGDLKYMFVGPNDHARVSGQRVPTLPKNWTEIDLAIRVTNRNTVFIQVLTTRVFWESVYALITIVRGHPEFKALFVTVPQVFRDYCGQRSAEETIVSMLFEQYFKQWAMYDLKVEGDDSAFGFPSLVYYKWLHEGVEDNIPEYATSILGGGALVLSPDGTELLLVKDGRFDSWGRAGGAVDAHETALECAKREAGEEANVKIDDRDAVQVMTYMKKDARDGKVADTFLYYIVWAINKEAAPSPPETTDVHWFPVRTLVDAFQSVIETGSELKFTTKVDIEGTEFKIGTQELCALWKYMNPEQRGKRVKISGIECW